MTDNNTLFCNVRHTKVHFCLFEPTLLLSISQLGRIYQAYKCDTCSTVEWRKLPQLESLQKSYGGIIIDE